MHLGIISGENIIEDKAINEAVGPILLLSIPYRSHASVMSPVRKSFIFPTAFMPRKNICVRLIAAQKKILIDFL